MMHVVHLAHFLSIVRTLKVLIIFQPHLTTLASKVSRFGQNLSKAGRSNWGEVKVVP